MSKVTKIIITSTAVKFVLLKTIGLCVGLALPLTPKNLFSNPLAICQYCYSPSFLLLFFPLNKFYSFSLNFPSNFTFVTFNFTAFLSLFFVPLFLFSPSLNLDIIPPSGSRGGLLDRSTARYFYKGSNTSTQ